MIIARLVQSILVWRDSFFEHIFIGRYSGQSPIDSLRDIFENGGGMVAVLVNIGGVVIALHKWFEQASV